MSQTLYERSPGYSLFTQRRCYKIIVLTIDLVIYSILFGVKTQVHLLKLSLGIPKLRISSYDQIYKEIKSEL